MAKRAEQIPHGTIGGYNNHGCRCDLCKEAKRAQQRRYRKANPDRDQTTGRVKGARDAGTPRKPKTSGSSDEATEAVSGVQVEPTEAAPSHPPVWAPHVLSSAQAKRDVRPIPKSSKKA